MCSIFTESGFGSVDHVLTLVLELCCEAYTSEGEKTITEMCVGHAAGELASYYFANKRRVSVLM